MFMFFFTRCITMVLLVALVIVGSACRVASPEVVFPIAMSATPVGLGVPDATLNPSQTPTATLVPYTPPPTVTAAPSLCSDELRPTRLVVWERGIVIDDNGAEVDELVNVREGPGTGNPIVDQIGIDDVFLVIDGPECSALYAWYQIQFGDVVGWIAEGDSEAYYVAPYLPE